MGTREDEVRELCEGIHTRVVAILEAERENFKRDFIVSVWNTIGRTCTHCAANFLIYEDEASAYFDTKFDETVIDPIQGILDALSAVRLDELTARPSKIPVYVHRPRRTTRDPSRR